MFVISVYKQHQKICQHARTFLMTTFVFGRWPVKHNLASRQYRRFNLWYCCHQIVWSTLWVVHCFHRSQLFFHDFTQFWSHLVLTQFWCNFASQKPIFKFASLWCAVQSLSWNIGRKSIFQYSLLMRTFTFPRWKILSKSKFQAKLSCSDWQTSLKKNQH